jgi:hypothetical protein
MVRRTIWGGPPAPRGRSSVHPFRLRRRVLPAFPERALESPRGQWSAAPHERHARILVRLTNSPREVSA